jgi:hypothetical protein
MTSYPSEELQLLSVLGIVGSAMKNTRPKMAGLVCTMEEWLVVGAPALSVDSL